MLFNGNYNNCLNIYMIYTKHFLTETRKTRSTWHGEQNSLFFLYNLLVCISAFSFFFACSLQFSTGKQGIEYYGKLILLINILHVIWMLSLDFYEEIDFLESSENCVSPEISEDLATVLASGICCSRTSKGARYTVYACMCLYV